MKRSLSTLLSIAPGEEQKTSLLYILHLLFYLGLMWGEAARDTFYIQAGLANEMAQAFIILAGVGFVMGLFYTFVAVRISSGTLLKIILGVMVLWLISVRILLANNSEPHGLVYSYFYIAYSVFRDISSLHILLYINDVLRYPRLQTRLAASALSGNCRQRAGRF